MFLNPGGVPPATCACAELVARAHGLAAPVAVPTVNAARAADRSERAVDAQEEEVLVWLTRAMRDLAEPTADKARTIAGQAEAYLRSPGLRTDTRAQLLIVASWSYSHLCQRRIQPIANGDKAFAAVAAAIRLAPGRADVVAAYARSLYAMWTLSWPVRRFAALHLGIDLAAETRRTLVLLEMFPEDPMATALAARLAERTGPGDLAALTKARLEALRKSAPAEVERVERELSGNQDSGD